MKDVCARQSLIEICIDGAPLKPNESMKELMMCKISMVVRRMLSLMEDLKQRTTMTTVGKHWWGAGQSSSDAFVRDLVENGYQVSKSV